MPEARCSRRSGPISTALPDVRQIELPLVLVPSLTALHWADHEGHVLLFPHISRHFCQACDEISSAACASCCSRCDTLHKAAHVYVAADLKRCAESSETRRVGD